MQSYNCSYACSLQSSVAIVYILCGVLCCVVATTILSIFDIDILLLELKKEPPDFKKKEIDDTVNEESKRVKDELIEKVKLKQDIGDNEIIKTEIKEEATDCIENQEKEQLAQLTEKETEKKNEISEEYRDNTKEGESDKENNEKLNAVIKAVEKDDISLIKSFEENVKPDESGKTRINSHFNYIIWTRFSFVLLFYVFIHKVKRKRPDTESSTLEKGTDSQKVDRPQPELCEATPSAADDNTNPVSSHVNETEKSDDKHANPSETTNNEESGRRETGVTEERTLQETEEHSVDVNFNGKTEESKSKTDESDSKTTETDGEDHKEADNENVERKRKRNRSGTSETGSEDSLNSSVEDSVGSGESMEPPNKRKRNKLLVKRAAQIRKEEDAHAVGSGDTSAEESAKQVGVSNGRE